MQPAPVMHNPLMVTRMFGAAMLLMFAMALALMGCEREEKILDVETPGANVEIEKTTDLSGNEGLEIETND